MKGLFILSTSKLYFMAIGEQTSRIFGMEIGTSKAINK